MKASGQDPVSVSVIISNFNGARYLPRLLQTLRAQQDVETQIIIVDRQSTDGSAEFLAEQTDLIVTSESPS